MDIFFISKIFYDCISKITENYRCGRNSGTLSPENLTITIPQAETPAQAEAEEETGTKKGTRPHRHL